VVGFLPRVDAHVALEGLQVAEVRAADLAGVRLLARVDEHVGAEVGHLDGKEVHVNVSYQNKMSSRLKIALQIASCR